MSPAQPPPSPCREAPSFLLSLAENVSEQPASLVAPAACSLEHPVCGARERQRLERYVPRPRHVHEEEALTAEQALLDPALHLDVVLHSRFDHDHAAGVD